MLYTLVGVLLCAMISSVQSGCCFSHKNEVSCKAELANNCVWLQPTDPLYTAEKPCVSAMASPCDADKGPCPVVPPTTPKMCELDSCKSTKFIANVLMVIDESGSVGKTNYQLSLDFVQNFVLKDIPSVSAVGMLAFSSETDIITPKWTKDKNELKAALDKERADYASRYTCTGKALQAALLAWKIAPSAHQNYMFLLTDGVPYCPYDKQQEEICKYKHYLQNVRIITVGVSKYPNSLDLSKFECLSDDKDLVPIEGFDPVKFYEAESQLRQLTCPPDSTSSSSVVAESGNSNSNSNSNSNTHSSSSSTNSKASKQEEKVLMAAATTTEQAYSSYLTQMPFVWIALSAIAVLAVLYALRYVLCSSGDAKYIALKDGAEQKPQYDAI